MHTYIDGIIGQFTILVRCIKRTMAPMALMPDYFHAWHQFIAPPSPRLQPIKSVPWVLWCLHILCCVPLNWWSRDGNHEFTTCEWNALLSPAYFFSRSELKMHEICSSSWVRKHEFTSWMECNSQDRELVVQWNAVLGRNRFAKLVLDSFPKPVSDSAYKSITLGSLCSTGRQGRCDKVFL